MAAWLASIVALIAESLIKLLGEDILNYIKKEEAIKAQQAANQAAATNSVQPLKDAKTGAEVDSATHSALDNT